MYNFVHFLIDINNSPLSRYELDPVINTDILPSSLYAFTTGSKFLTFSISSINKYLKSLSVILLSISSSNCSGVTIFLNSFLSNSMEIISFSGIPFSCYSSIIDFSKVDFTHLLIPVITFIILPSS